MPEDERLADKTYGFLLLILAKVISNLVEIFFAKALNFQKNVITLVACKETC